MTPNMTDENKKLELVAYCVTRWETWEMVIKRMLILKEVRRTIYADKPASDSSVEPIKYFLLSADDASEVPSAKKSRYEALAFSGLEWEYLQKILGVLTVCRLIKFQSLFLNLLCHF